MRCCVARRLLIGFGSFLQARRRVVWAVAAAAAAFLVFLSTLQIRVNGSEHPYATDVGEIQNALPRWGIIHDSGYPFYMAMGFPFVAVLRLAGIQPAAGASLLSALWGGVTIGLLVALVQELGVPGPLAALGGLAVALSTSVWVDSSLAEVHTLTLAFSAATLLSALRFGRTGGRRDLVLLALIFAQGVGHQRAVALLAPAVALLVWPSRRVLWRSPGVLVGSLLLVLLVYLTLPLRVWMGVTWVYGAPGTWEGFLDKLFVDQAQLVVQWPAGPDEWLARAGGVARMLGDDMPWPLLVLGLLGLGWPAPKGERRERLGLTLAWMPYVLLALVIWEGRVSDALLASKLPVLVLAGIGLALALARLRRRSPAPGVVAAVALALLLLAWGAHVRPFVLSITRDASTDEVIAIVEQVTSPDEGGRPIAVMVPWSHDYWALTYAQAYLGQLPGLTLVDHNVDLGQILARGDRLLTPGKTFHVFPLSWWEERLGPLYLASAAPGLIELSQAPLYAIEDVPAASEFDLGNGLVILSAGLEWEGADSLLLDIYWCARQPVEEDYSVAVHLLAHDPPRGGEDVLAQADSRHPLEGWYPTSRWRAGEIVRELTRIRVPAGSAPVGVRVALYLVDPQGGFLDSPWLFLPLPAREG